jgi:hypothetical protein
VAQFVVSPTSMSAQHGQERLTKPAPAVRATGVADRGRARASGDSLSATGILPRAAGDASEKAR